MSGRKGPGIPYATKLHEKMNAMAAHSITSNTKRLLDELGRKAPYLAPSTRGGEGFPIVLNIMTICFVAGWEQPVLAICYLRITVTFPKG